MTQITPAKPADYPAIAEIYNTYIELGTANMIESPKSADYLASMVASFGAREGLFVLKEHEQLIGWGVIKRYSDREGYRFACETAIYLALDQTGKGYGTQMKKFLIDKCRELGYRHLVAKIFATNQASISYNLKLGYELVGTQKKIGFRDGKWVDVVIMQYLIPEGEEQNPPPAANSAEHK